MIRCLYSPNKRMIILMNENQIKCCQADTLAVEQSGTKECLFLGWNLFLSSGNTQSFLFDFPFNHIFHLVRSLGCASESRFSCRTWMVAIWPFHQLASNYQQAAATCGLFVTKKNILIKLVGSPKCTCVDILQIEKKTKASSLLITSHHQPSQ